MAAGIGVDDFGIGPVHRHTFLALENCGHRLDVLRLFAWPNQDASGRLGPPVSDILRGSLDRKH